MEVIGAKLQIVNFEYSDAIQIEQVQKFLSTFTDATSHMLEVVRLSETGQK